MKRKPKRTLCDVLKIAEQLGFSYGKAVVMLEPIGCADVEGIVMQAKSIGLDPKLVARVLELGV